ncbi:winged helix-turn-helix domain-containing protein [Montanilutibacter psychrotolerans]|uniref:OmpR/PhoB-type domain-containing protein n=1 Tax=Montanilutibacter psychrotolerans TaxID=1327343 RepID=A0A3M8SSS0_9GAMM|nr:winged helix-turn-helix domain-containing protein [Lysobacter psychrotolerans]RNF81910.1 hypothetical protein EER27_15860 [Lysobacter psychrotolerans]
MSFRPDFPPPSLPSGRLRVGDCEVDLSLREIRATGARRARRVTPKAIAVLEVLASNAGKVVGRDALLAAVWPDTLPTNDVVTQAVTQLRKAFGEARATPGTDPRYIETIAKNGYRLLVSVEWLGESTTVAASTAEYTHESATDVGTDDPSRSTSPSAHRPDAVAVASAALDTIATRTRPRLRVAPLERFLVTAVALLAVSALVLVLVLREPRAEPAAAPRTTWLKQPSGPDRPYRLITSSPGFELSPTLSPDGSMIAYAATQPGGFDTAIMVQATDQSQPRPLATLRPGVSERLPAWSPDGREIAFVRAGPEAQCQVVIAASNGGAERTVAGCLRNEFFSFAWTPDGKGLVFGSMQTSRGPTGLQVLDLASGTFRELKYDGARASYDHMPRYSPDGRWLVFVRNPQLGDLWRIPAAGGKAEALTRQSAELRGWDWLPDGDGIVFGRRIDSETRLYRLDMASREVRDLGLDDAQSPAIAGKAGVMAFVRRRPLYGIFRIDRTELLSGKHTGEPAREHLFASSGRDTQPAVAPDGRQLAFTSDRSGKFGLWWADLEHPETLRQIEGIHPETRRIPEWSADSQRLLVVGSDRAGRFGVHEVMPSNGQVTILPVPRANLLQASYLPDPSRMLVLAGNDDGRPKLVLYDRSTTPWRQLAAIDDVSMVRVDAQRGRTLFTRLSAAGLWQVDLSLSPGSVRRLDDRAPAPWSFQTWALGNEGGLVYLDQVPGCLSMLSEIGLADGQVAKKRCLVADRLASTNGFSLDSRTRSMYLSLTVEDGTDIAFMPLPAEPRTLVPGWFK